MRITNIVNRLRVAFKHFAIAFAVAAGFCAGSAPAQVTRTYTNGQNDTTAYSTSAPNDPTTLAIASGSAEQSGILSEIGGVNKSGTATLTFSGTNNSTGPTSVTAGTYTFSGGPIATGSLTKNGPGNLTISGNNTYSGGTIINGGQLTMDLQANMALGSGPVTLNSPATLFLNRINATNPLGEPVAHPDCHDHSPHLQPV